MLISCPLLLGGVVTTIVGVTRILIYSLPRKGNKLGQNCPRHLG